MNEVKTTTIKIPRDTLIKIKAIAVEEGTSQNNIINDLINKGLKIIGENKGKIKAQKINDKLPKIKGESENIEDLAGFIKLDDPGHANVNEVIDSIHTKKELYL